MAQTSPVLSLRVKVPGEDSPRTFSLDQDTRFSDIFRTLIKEGCFSLPSGEKPVWVLFCGGQDLVTWDSSRNIFFDRFPFGEPAIAAVPSWMAQEVQFTSYPDGLARAEFLYRTFRGSRFFMGHEGFLPEYKSYHVPAGLESRWAEH